MVPLTRKEWDRECTKRISARLGRGFSHDAGKVMWETNAEMAQEFGPRPRPDELPWTVRTGVSIALGTVIPDKGVRIMAQRIIVSLLYAVGAIAAVVQGTGVPTTPEAWVGLVVAFVTTFWGKFSSSQTIIAANRTAWTDEQRKAEALAELNK